MYPKNKFILVFTILIVSITSYGQPGGGPPGGGEVPITGIEVLLGLGGALGVKKLFGKQKKR